jgi:hypothetical protein
MRRIASALSAVLCSATLLLAQMAAPQSGAPPNPTAPNSTQPTPKVPKGFVLEDATPIKLKINRTVSSADAHVGDTVDFEVLEDVLVKDTLVVPKGGLAFATVTEAQAKRRMARGGKLDVNIDYVRLLDGEKAALRAVEDVKGGGHTGAMTGAIVATSIVFFPAAPLFLFMHGKDITIPKGTEITAYVNGDMKLDIAKFTPHDIVAPPSAAPATTAASAQAQMQISSDPPGADIEIDGNFVGDTPSTVGVATGQHEITVKKSGFKPWDRKMMVSGGQVNVNATLEAEVK